jgi:epoxyqueuosine reductase
MHGGMDYMARNADSRRDIRAWMPDAKSVLMCGFSYGDPAAAHAPKAGHGRLARYAVRPDYHGLLRARMSALRDWLAAVVPGVHAVPFCDMSPILERSYARAAGLGWQGRNTMMIAPDLGSYFLLAGLAIDRDLPADSPEADHCGTCRLCLDACPTEAFPREYVLDASKCVAYFTIEHKGPIPEEFRAGVGDWVYGCDVCQEVCPWNRFEAPARALPPAKIATELPLEELAAAPDLRSRLKGLPVARAMRRKMTRNALLAMGNSGDPSHRPTLERFASNADATLAEQARWSLERLAAGEEC